MKKTNCFLTLVIFLSIVLVAQGCDHLAYRAGAKMGHSIRMNKEMNNMVEAMYERRIPLNYNPLLPPHGKSYLATVSPLTICLLTFKDSRKGTNGKIPSFTEPVDSVITRAIGNELKRNNHVLIENAAEQNNCDFTISGSITEFSSLPFRLIEDSEFTKKNKNYNWVTRVAFEIEVEGGKNCNLSLKRQYTKVSLQKWHSTEKEFSGWDAVPSFEQVGATLDEALLETIRDFSVDEDLVQVLLCQSGRTSSGE